MFVPIFDSNGLKSIPFQFVTVLLIIINVVIYAITSVDPSVFNQATSFAVVPDELWRETSGGGYVPGAPADQHDDIPVPESFTLVSYMFFHGSWLHLIGNMLFLWVFGDNVEDAVGHLKFLVFYLLCGIAAGLTHAVMNAGSPIPMIGASGATAGCVMAYLMLHPKVQLWVLVFKVLPVQIPAFWALGAWIVMQFIFAVAPQVDPVAWWAHVGGIVAGAVLIIFMRRPGVALFDQDLQPQSAAPGGH